MPVAAVTCGGRPTVSSGIQQRNVGQQLRGHHRCLGRGPGRDDGYGRHLRPGPGSRGDLDQRQPGAGEVADSVRFGERLGRIAQSGDQFLPRPSNFRRPGRSRCRSFRCARGQARPIRCFPAGPHERPGRPNRPGPSRSDCSMPLHAALPQRFRGRSPARSGRRTSRRRSRRAGGLTPAHRRMDRAVLNLSGLMCPEVIVLQWPLRGPGHRRRQCPARRRA